MTRMKPVLLPVVLLLVSSQQSLAAEPCVVQAVPTSKARLLSTPQRFRPVDAGAFCSRRDERSQIYSPAQACSSGSRFSKAVLVTQ
ncbi:hypothetical protein MXD81_59810 [Microbacteriaceae bacterium K1510]|nr:hypothetical protein [Microbacteriaceae bacterium K1510]